MPNGRGLGRRVPPNFEHVERRRAGAVLPPTVAKVERLLDLPTQYVPWYDQGSEGACVGFSLSWMMSILNRRKYLAMKLYGAAQQVDVWPDTPPESGTSVSAGCWVLEHNGHWRYFRGLEKALGWSEGIQAVRWATTVDEVRTSIALGIPVVVGVNWYEAFFSPEYYLKEWWIGRGDWGGIAGGHAICIYGASDLRQAVRYVNTWGFDYPKPWMSYDKLRRLIGEDGEIALVTDRLEPLLLAA